MKKKVIVIVALIIAAGVGLSLFLNHTFQAPPYPLPVSSMVAYRITGQEIDNRFFGNDPNSIHGYAIVQRQPILDAQLRQDVVDMLNSRLMYGRQGFACFEPGIAIRLGEGEDRVDILICLECQHVYFFVAKRARV